MKNINGFTLVELIVVITILSILGTVAFVSLQGYGRDARNSTRISDLKIIEKTLVIHRTEGNKYPDPEGAVSFTYSGATVWDQGTFGQSAIRELGTISSAPTDPLTKNEYAYSITNLKNEFQVAGVLEGYNLGSTNLLIGDTYAAGNRRGNTLLVGDYNGKIAKTSSGSITYLLALPTIISGDMSLLDVISLISAQKLAYKGSGVIPGSYVNDPNSDFDDTQVLDYSPAPLELFSGDATNLEIQANQVMFFKNLQEAYSGSIIADIDGDIANIINTDLSDTNNPSSDVKNLASAIINNSAKINVPNFGTAPVSQSDPVFGTCELTQVEINDLNDFFDYSGSIYQFTTGQEWCDVTSINANSKSIAKEIPYILGNLESLTYISLSGNSLTGQLPGELGNNLSDLTYLNVYNNDLDGSIPSNYGNLTNLETFNLSENDFSGNIPSELGNLTNLETLNFASNNFSGTLHADLGTLGDIDQILLKNNNLTGTIPASFSGLTSLTWLDLSGNGFTGTLPISIGNLSLLERLYLYNNDFDQLPDSMVDLINLYVLVTHTNPQLGNLAATFYSSTPSKSQTGITDTGKEMTIVGNGITLDITIN